MEREPLSATSQKLLESVQPQPTYPVLRASRVVLRLAAVLFALYQLAVLFVVDGNPDDALSFSLSHYLGPAATAGRLVDVAIRVFVLLALAEAIQLGLELRKKLAHA